MANDLGNYYGTTPQKIVKKDKPASSSVKENIWAGYTGASASSSGASTAGTAATGAATTTGAAKKTGRTFEELMQYNQKTGYPVMPETGYTTRQTVPTPGAELDAAAPPVAAATELTPEEEAEALERRTFGLANTGVDLNWTNIDTPNRGPQGSFQGRDMDSALGQLQAEYARNMGTYRPKTEEEIQEQAALDYQSYYDQLRRAAGNEYAMNDLALQQQREGLQSGYDKSRAASKKEYAEELSRADRYLLSRGMQRSSYGAQTLSNIGLKGAEAQQAIWDAQLEQERNIDQQRRQLLGNYANTLQGYDAGQASDVMSRVWGLRDTEYDRNVTRANTLNQLATQIYGYLNNLNQADREQYNTEATMRENQFQFDTGVAQSRQALEDARTQYAANLAEEMRQYNNTANMNELAFRQQFPTMGFTRAADGRLVLDQEQNSRALMNQRYSELEAAYQEALNRPINVVVQSGGPSYGEQVAAAKSAELVAAKKTTGNTTSTTTGNTSKQTQTSGKTVSTSPTGFDYATLTTDLNKYLGGS